jgi:outer membrane protein OmpA-like peptidoglycan-associated protein
MNAGIYAKTIELIMSEDGKLKIVKPLAPTLENDEEKLTQADLNNTILLHNIYFERTKPIVLPESIPSINKLAEVLLRRPRLYINIIGHTDNVGDPDALKTLSEERAFAIKKILVEKGVPEYRVSTAGYGGSHPIAPNDTEENKSKNRRVEIRIVSQ